MRMTRFSWIAIGLIVATALIAVAVAFSTRGRWQCWLAGNSSANGEEAHPPVAAESKMLELSVQGRKNLGLVSKPVVLKTYWRKIQVPGVLVDRPGLSDRGITAPAVGVVIRIHAFPGDTVKSGERLFTLRLISDHLHNTQSELFKAKHEIQLVKEQLARLEEVAKRGSIPEATLIKLENQLRRLTAAVQAHRQDLMVRGLSPVQMESVAKGKFISEIEVAAPPPLAADKQLVSTQAESRAMTIVDGALVYEVQELKAELGQQVQAGQLLSVLANHRSLYIEGHSFKREAPYLERAAKNNWPVEVQFDEHENGWPPLDETFSIRHLANTLDPASRTFDFYLPLLNQSRSYEKDGRTLLVWRFRPGQHVYLRVPVEEFKDVIVLPSAAMVREGPEAYVFVQNGDLFERRSVHVLYEDRLNVVLANDGSVASGLYLAQGAAASLNRVLKAQNASGGLPPGAHFHADGSLHIPGQ